MIHRKCKAELSRLNDELNECREALDECRQALRNCQSEAALFEIIEEKYEKVLNDIVATADPGGRVVEIVEELFPYTVTTPNLPVITVGIVVVEDEGLWAHRLERFVAEFGERVTASLEETLVNARVSIRTEDRCRVIELNAKYRGTFETCIGKVNGFIREVTPRNKVKMYESDPEKGEAWFRVASS